MSFSLRLFGGASILGGEGPLTGPAAQRHRLALLALLATSRTRSLARDRLLALLWPESDAERARHTLNVAVHALRKALGEDALLSAGDELRLDERVVPSDTGAFEEALAAGDPARAVALYGGPFLDGFFLGGAPELERWAEGERARFAASYAGALEALAEEAEGKGDPREAARWWRRLAAHDPYSSRVAVRLMRSLGESGDRAGAVQHARIHAALLREELGVEPGPEVAALEKRLREPAPPAPAPAIPPPPGTGDAPAPPVAEGVRASLPPPAARPRRRTAALAGFVAVALALAGYGAWHRSGWGTAPGEQPGVVVLPFADDSRGRANEYFTDGLADEIISALTRVEGLRVVARTSAFAYKGKPVGTREVGEQLGVEHVLEGSVREAGDRLRVSVRLVRARDGVPVWAETFDRRMDDVLVVQDEISGAVVHALRDRLAGGEPVRPAPRPTPDLEAYDLYLQGRHAFYRRSPDGLRRALALFRESATRDPRYPLPLVGIADVYNVLGAFDYGGLPPGSAYPRARVAAEGALALDPRLGEARAALANALLNHDWDADAAEREFRRALELSPGYAPAHHWYSLHLLATGRPRESFAEVRRARELDPLSSVTGTAVARHLYYTRRYERSAAGYREVLAADSGFVTARLGLGVVYARLGEHGRALAEYRLAVRGMGGPQPVTLALLGHAYGAAGDRVRAREALGALEAAARERYVPAEYRALVHLGLGESAEALGWLERAYRDRSGAMVYLEVEPLLDPLREEPRFRELVRRVGLRRPH